MLLGEGNQDRKIWKEIEGRAFQKKEEKERHLREERNIERMEVSKEKRKNEKVKRRGDRDTHQSMEDTRKQINSKKPSGKWTGRKVFVVAFCLFY